MPVRDWKLTDMFKVEPRSVGIVWVIPAYTKCDRILRYVNGVNMNQIYNKYLINKIK